jgi:hypothetical protein
MNVVQANLQFKDKLEPLILDNIDFIIVHHADAKVASVEDVHAWHLAKGWSGFGYNEYIRKDGTVYIGRGDNVGAHTKGYNYNGYGICCEGDYEVELTMPDAQFKSLVERLKYNKARFNNMKTIVPHKQFTETSCPGKYFPLESILKEVYTEPREHWALKHYNALITQGYIIHDKRFDDPITRGEVFALLAQRNRL